MYMLIVSIIHKFDIFYRNPVSLNGNDDCPNGNNIFIYLKCDPNIEDYKTTLPQLVFFYF